MKEEIDFIYALRIVGYESYFYIGRTNDLKRRMGEHRYAAAAGDTETKYQVIREIIAAGDEWEHVVLAEVSSADENYEDWYVFNALLDGHPLVNMKQGDAHRAVRDAENTMMARRTRYSNAKAFLDAREREVQEQRARAATARLQARVSRQARVANDTSCVTLKLFAWESPEEFRKRTESAGLAAIRAKREQEKQLKEWLKACRSEP